MMGNTLGIDFGTSNSAAGFLHKGKPRLITLGAGQPTIPTTFFFDFETRQTLLGDAASRALLAGAEGRFMRALKRVLGTSLMHEKRQILNDRVTFVDIIARFLRHIKSSAEAETGLRFDHALAGRPVVFHGQNDPREGQALADLRACFDAAGFKTVRFLAEPEAAAIASGVLKQGGQTGLIIDIGGGTSDFTVFRSNPTGTSIMASHGVRIGGTDFDRSISIDHVMPLFGKGGQLRKTIGAGLTPVPAALFNDLATWERIPFVYTAQNRKLAQDMLRLAQSPTPMTRLSQVLEHELAHDVSFAVERGKIAANSGQDGAQIALGIVEAGLIAPLSPAALAQGLAIHAAPLAGAMADTVQMAGLSLNEIDQVIYVGGSSLMSLVTQTAAHAFPRAKHVQTDVFTAVANGLAIAAG